MELIGPKEVSDMTGVPVGTLRFGGIRTSDRLASRWAAESCIGVTRFCGGSRSKRAQPGAEARRCMTPRYEKTPGLAEVFRPNHPIAHPEVPHETSPPCPGQSTMY